MRGLALVLAIVALSGCREHKAAEATGGHDHGAAAPRATGGEQRHASAAAPLLLADGGTPNVVQAEMLLLTAAMTTAVVGVGQMDVRGVAPALHRVHEAKGATAAALKSGSYTLPKNPDQVAQFVGLDEAFHGHLEKLVEASIANDVPATAVALGKTLEGCVPCHAAFRKPQ